MLPETLFAIGLIIVAIPFVVVVGFEDLFTVHESKVSMFGRVFFTAVAFVVFRSINRRFRLFSLADDSIVVRTGILQKKTTVIPFDRLHNIDTTQSLLQRPFNTSTATLRTAGGAGEEAKLEGVRQSDVVEMRTLLAEYRKITTDEADSEELDATTSEEDETELNALSSLSTLDCIKLVFIRSNVIAFMAVLFGFSMQYLGGLENLIGDWIVPLDIRDYLTVEVLTSPVPWLDISLNPEADWSNVALWIGQLVIPVLLIFVLISIVYVISIYKGFRLTHDEEMFDAQCGSVVRSRKRTPKTRVQMVQVESTLRTRIFGRESIRFGTSAHESDSMGAAPLGTWLVPLIKPEETNHVIEQAVPLADLSEANWETINAKRAWPRILKKHMIYIVPLTLALTLFSVWLLLAAIPMVAWATYSSKRTARSIRFSLLENSVTYRQGWIKRLWTTRAYSKLQGVAVVQNPFDQKHGTASLLMRSARNDGKSEIPFIEVGRAHELAAKLHEASAVYDFEW